MSRTQRTGIEHDPRTGRFSKPDPDDDQRAADYRATEEYAPNAYPVWDAETGTFMWCGG